MATWPPRFTATANDILNQVGAEIGLDPVVDPFTSSDQTYRQMTFLINTCGEELCHLHPWQAFESEYAFDPTTPVGSNGSLSAYYDLPDGFQYMINQSGWDADNSRPLRGPVSSQEWQYLINGGSTGIAGEFAWMISNDYLHITPNPSGVTTALTFRYQDKRWVNDATGGGLVRVTAINEGGDTPLFDRTLISRMLKVKILEARGFDTSKAQADFNQAFQMVIGREKGAPKLSAGRYSFNPYRLNIPDTGYGS